MKLFLEKSTKIMAIKKTLLEADMRLIDATTKFILDYQHFLDTSLSTDRFLVSITVTSGEDV